MRKRNLYKITSYYSREKCRIIAFFVLLSLQKGVERQTDDAGLAKTREIKKSCWPKFDP